MQTLCISFLQQHLGLWHWFTYSSCFSCPFPERRAGSAVHGWRPGRAPAPAPALPSLGCSSYSLAQRDSLSMSLVVYQAFSSSLSTSVSIPVSYFFSFLALLICDLGFEDHIHLSPHLHILLPFTACETSGPGCLPHRFGAEFLVSYCICIYAAALICSYKYEWLHLLLAPSSLPYWYGALRRPTVSHFSAIRCLSVSSLLMYITYFDF